MAYVCNVVSSGGRSLQERCVCNAAIILIAPVNTGEIYESRVLPINLVHFDISDLKSLLLDPDVIFVVSFNKSRDTDTLDITIS